MNEEQPVRRGRDFAIGFLGGLAAAVLLGVFSGIGLSDNTFRFVSQIFSAALGFVALGIIIGGFVRKRPFISIGILSALVALPLLLVGSCFAFFAYNGF